MKTSHGQWPLLVLLWTCGACLRLTVLAVPPVISIIQSDLHLSGTEIGLLTGIPVVLFAIAASPGSALLARFGVRTMLLAGSLTIAVGGALRALSATIWELYLASIVMGFGVAIMQPCMAAAVRSWVPARATFATAVYTNGLIVAEIVPVATMLPLVLPYAGTWRLALAAWSIPVAATAILVLLLSPKSPAQVTSSQPVRWWPELNSWLNWRIGMCLASVGSSYFCINGFLPAYLDGHGHPELVSAALTAINLGQAPTSFLLLFYADKLQGKWWPHILSGVALAVSVIGIVTTASYWTVFWAAVAGATCGWVLSLGLTLAPLLCRNPDDVARTSAAAFAVSYGFTMLMSYLAGASWDMTHDVDAAFGPIFLGTLPVIVMAPLLLRPARR